MRFVVEALGLTAGGGKQLALDLFLHLARHTQHEFVLLLPDLAEYPGVAAANLRCILCPKPRSLRARYRFLNHAVPRICLEERADALLCLGNFVPRRPPCPTVLLLHNAHMVYREALTESRLTLRERLTRRYGRYALRSLPPRTRVIVQAPVMRQRLIDQYWLDADRVAVIPNACFFPDGGGTRRGGFTAAPPISSGQVPGGVTSESAFTFICLTEYYPHKNLEVLVEAVKLLPGEAQRAGRCLITIRPDQHPRARLLLKQIGREGMSNRVVNIGPVPRECLAEVYSSADALILPTLLESFSRTYFEAMHFGLPILTSDRDFARHICRDAALYFDPLDAGSVAGTMARIMEDGELRARLAANGKRLLRQSPTWDEIAAQFVGVLEKAAGCRQGSPCVAEVPQIRETVLPNR